MALYVNYQELVHRVFHDYEAYDRNGVDVTEIGTKLVLKAINEIMESVAKNGVNLYPKERRGAKLREIRLQKRVSVARLSRETGISRAAIYRIENGHTGKPTIDTMHKIAGVLNVDASELGG